MSEPETYGIPAADSENAPTRRRRATRVLIGFVRALMWVLLAALCLVTSTLVHLESTPARDFACSLGRELGSQAIAGSMDFRCVDIDFRLPLSVTATVEDIELFDADGELVVDAERASASAAIFPLLGGELLLSEVLIRSPHVSLATNANGELRIANAFLPVESESEPEPGPSTFVMRIQGAITGASVRDVPGIDVQVDGLGLELRIEVVGESVEIHASQRESAGVMLNGENYGELSELEYDAELRDDGSMGAALRLAAADGHVEVSASMPWVNDTLGALDGQLRGVVTGAMLHPFVGEDLLGGPTEVALAIRSADPVADSDPSPFDALMVEGDLRTPGGEVALEGSVELSGPLRAALALRSSRLDLASALAAELGVTGTVRFDLTTTANESDSGWDIGVQGDDIAYDTWEVQRLVADATVRSDEVVLSRLDLPTLSEGGHMNVSGRFGFDGSVDVNVDANLPRLSRQTSLVLVLPGLDGGARIEAEVSIRDDALNARADVSVSNFRMQDVRVAHASIHASATGPIAAPRLDARVRAGATHAYGVELTRVDLRANGEGPYRIRGRLEGPAQFVDRAVAIDVDVALGIRDGVQATGSVVASGLFPQPISIDVQRFAVGERALSVGALTLRAPGVLNATMQGRVSFRGHSDFSFQVDDASFAPIGDLLGVPIEGNLVASGEFHGSIARPALRSQGRVTSLRYATLELESLQWDTTIEQNGRDADLGLVLDAVGDIVGRIGVRLHGTAPSRNLSGDWRRAPLDLQVSLSGTETAPLTDALRALLNADAPADISVPEVALPEVSGTLGLELHATGSYLDPQTFDLLVALADFAYPELGVRVPRIEFEAGLTDGNLVAALVLKEPSSPYLHLQAAVTFDRHAWEQNPREILQHPWSVDLRIPERGVRDFPLEMVEGLEGRIGLRAHFEGQGRDSSLGGAAGTVFATASYPPAAAGEDGESCRLRSSAITLGGRLDGGVFTLDGRLRSTGAERATLTATMPLPLDRWALETPERLSPIEANLTVSALPLSGIPVVCAELDGEVNLEARLQNVFGDQPLVDLRGTIARLQSTSARDDSPPADFNIEAHGSADRATVSLRLAGENSELFVAEGEVPMAMDEDLHLPLPDLGAWQGRAEFNHAPLAILAAPVALIGSPRGHLSGEIHAQGDAASGVNVQGEIQLEEVGFTLREPLLRVERLGGRVVLDDDQLVLDDVGFQDRGGTILINGRVGLDRWRLGRVEARASLDDFPFRVEGVVYATLDTEIDITGEFGDPLNEFDVELHDAAIQISPDVGRQVQSLAQHPDVTYEADGSFSALAETLLVSRSSAEVDESETRIHLQSNPFYVRREDFSVQVAPDLIAVIDRFGVRLEGTVEIRRGFLAILGKQFDFERSEIRFAGGRNLNPRLDITAVHELSNRQTVTVQLSGDLFSLDLNFSSSDPSAETEAEILALLIGGGSSSGDESSNQAKDDVLGFVTGLTAGALSSLTRRQLGEYLPVFGIESGTSGNRIRAAVQADRLIPDFLSSVVIGAHLEGYVGQQNEGDSGSSFAAGVELELMFPHNLLLNTRYQQGNTWGLELRWEP